MNSEKQEIAPASNEKQKQEASLIGRILSMEALLMLMGIASLAYGIINGIAINIFWGIIIIPGVFILTRVRKKDWKKHWEVLEAQQKQNQLRKQHPDTQSPAEKRD